MGIQMAEMIPGFEKLAGDLDDFTALVVEFVGYTEGLVKDRKGDELFLEDLYIEIEREAYNLTRRITGQAGLAMSNWVDELDIMTAAAKNDKLMYSRWGKKDQAKLDDLKDWART